jgi:hypothetical protein
LPPGYFRILGLALPVAESDKKKNMKNSMFFAITIAKVHENIDMAKSSQIKMNFLGSFDYLSYLCIVKKGCTHG